MKQLYQRFLTSLAIGCVVLNLLIILTCIGAVGLYKYSVWQSERTIEQTLASQIDMHFESVFKFLSPEANDAVVMPPTAEIWQGSVRQNIASTCGNNNGSAIKTLTAIYSDSSKSNTIWMYATLCQNKAQDYLPGMVGSRPCGAELGGEYRLRKTVLNPYLYQVCTGFGSNRLEGITWANGNWLITVSGNSDSMTQFLRDYPF